MAVERHGMSAGGDGSGKTWNECKGDGGGKTWNECWGRRKMSAGG